MLQIKFVDGFNAVDLVRENIRRGFVIPIRGCFDKTLIVINKDFSIDHDKVADDFIKLSDENLLKVLMSCNPNISAEDLKRSIWMCEQISDGYKEKKEEYPASRKDYLIYEEGAVCFDQKPGYSNKYIMYRGDGKGYYMSKQTDKVACSFLMAGFKEVLAPEDSKNAGPVFFQ